MTEYDHSKEIRIMRRTALAFFAVIVILLTTLYQKVTLTHNLIIAQQDLMMRVNAVTANLNGQISILQQAHDQQLNSVTTSKTPLTRAKPAPVTTNTSKATDDLAYQRTRANYQQTLVKARQLLEQQRIRSQISPQNFTIAPQQPVGVQSGGPESSSTYSTTGH